jgi:UDP-glucose:(glucosyl)LPS alpha-1,2-glucosyltransferase
MPIIYDDLNNNAFSGTEYSMHCLEQKLDKELLNNFYISRCVGTLSKLPNDKLKIFWAHQIPLPYIHNEPYWFMEKKWTSFDKVVFVSNWQKNFFKCYYDLDVNDDKNMDVIYNAIDINTFIENKKNENIIKLIYFSSPDRGLDILYDVFCQLCLKYDNIILDVFSSTCYNKTSPLKENSEKEFLELYKKLKTHPKINYSERINRDELQKKLVNYDIFVYPSVWPETSCLCLIESMSAGLMCVHPNYGCLYETSGGLTNQYDFSHDKKIHGENFKRELSFVIENIKNKNLKILKQKTLIKNRTNYVYNWDNSISKWNSTLNKYLNEKKIQLNYG